MTKNVEMTLVGSATALMSIDRRSSMKKRMTRIAIAPPKTIDDLDLVRVLADEARLLDDEVGADSRAGTSSRSRRASPATASLTAIVFVPDCLTHVERDGRLAVHADARAELLVAVLDARDVGEADARAVRPRSRR